MELLEDKACVSRVGWSEIDTVADKRDSETRPWRIVSGLLGEA